MYLFFSLGKTQPVAIRTIPWLNLSVDKTNLYKSIFTSDMSTRFFSEIQGKATKKTRKKRKYRINKVKTWKTS